MPKQYSPFVAAVISYTLPILPLCLAMAIIRSMAQNVLSLQKLLMVWPGAYTRPR